MKGYDDPATPDALDRVGVLKVGYKQAKHVLVLNPGTSGGSAYFKPLAHDIVRATRGRWQVWAVERRENQLEDHSVLDQAKRDEVTGEELFDYYLGWLADPSVTEHFELIPDSEVAFARGWGMKVEVNDLRRVVKAAARRDRQVVLGGHSLGGSITTAYATWDFNGKPGAKDLSGLVYIDGGSNPTPATPEQATESLQALEAGTPWLAFGGIAAPFLGIFSATGSTGAVVNTDEISLGWSFPLLPANLKPPVQPTNEAQFGYAVDADSSPPSLLAAQVNAGRLADSGDPRGWEGAGEITPIQRYAKMLAGRWVQGRRRQRLVPPAAPDDRLARGGQRQRQPRAGHPRRRRDARRRPEAQDADLRVRRRPRRPGRAGLGPGARPPVGHPQAPDDPGQPREHLHPQRPELRQPGERVRRPPDPVPGKDRRALSGRAVAGVLIAPADRVRNRRAGVTRQS